jgi:hypothetical protein
MLPQVTTCESGRDDRLKVEPEHPGDVVRIHFVNATVTDWPPDARGLMSRAPLVYADGAGIVVPAGGEASWQGRVVDGVEVVLPDADGYTVSAAVMRWCAGCGGCE